ncbi:hypothetical protein [Nostoc sp. C110]|uniref:hypothetical protein n=1 Tax=Nostoc sp. C110 TaxID=3349876 RepID=UPI00370DC9B4
MPLIRFSCTVLRRFAACRTHRIPCGYYRVSLHSEDLGDWSELGVLAVLSGLQQEFYRGRWGQVGGGVSFEAEG